MSIQMSAAPSVKPATLSALNEAAQAGLEFASAASGLEAALMKNQQTAANQLPKSPAAPPAAAPAAPAAPANGAQNGGPLGGILQQLMQLLQMLVPLLQQLGGGGGPQANGAAGNLAKQMPGAGGGPLGGGAMGAGAPMAGGAMGAGAPMAGGAMGAGQPMVAVPVMMLVPANSPLAMGQGGGAPMAGGQMAGAPMAGAPMAAQPVMTTGEQPFFGNTGIGVTTHEQAMDWARNIRPDASQSDLTLGAQLAGIFSGGRPL